MDVEAVRAIIRRQIRNAGSAAAFSRAVGVSDELVRLVVSGRRAPAGKLLAALGLERVVTYRRVRDG